MISGGGEFSFQSQQALFHALLPLAEQLEREVGNLGLQGCHLSLHVRKPGSQIGVGSSHRRLLAFRLRWRGTGKGSRHRRLKKAVVQIRQDKDLLTGQAFDPCIRRMGVQGHLGLSQPLAERFGINSEQLTTFNERQTGHAHSLLNEQQR
jgi:hypothetical protein